MGQADAFGIKSVVTGRDLSLRNYNMNIRKPNRAKDHDYSDDGYYFVTICTKNRKKYFGEIKNGKMILNKSGLIVKKQWEWLKKYKYIYLDILKIMPNHLHGILIIDSENVGTGRDLSLQKEKVKSLSELIGAFKTASSKLIHLHSDFNFQWQRSFYDRIIRNENELIKIREYIINNPLKWDLDENNLENIFI